MAIKLPSDGFNVARFNSTRGIENYDLSFVTYNHVQESINVIADNAIGINPANNSLQSYTIIIKNKVQIPNNNKLIFVSDSSQPNSKIIVDMCGGDGILNRGYTINATNGVLVQSFPLDKIDYIVAQSDFYYSYFTDVNLTPGTGNLHNGDFWFDIQTVKDYGDVTITNANFDFFNR